MPDYLVEIYVSAPDQAESARRIRDALERAAGEDASLRYVRTISLAEDEVCLHLVRARNAEALAQVLGDAGIRVDRLVGATETTAPREGSLSRGRRRLEAGRSRRAERGS